jgi:hypothetical protein
MKWNQTRTFSKADYLGFASRLWPETACNSVQCATAAVAAMARIAMKNPQLAASTDTSIPLSTPLNVSLLDGNIQQAHFYKYLLPRKNSSGNGRFSKTYLPKP